MISSLKLLISWFKIFGIVKTDIKQPKEKGNRITQLIEPIDPIIIS